MNDSLSGLYPPEHVSGVNVTVDDIDERTNQLRTETSAQRSLADMIVGN